MRKMAVPEIRRVCALVSHPRRRALLLVVAIAPDHGVPLQTAAELIRTLEIGVTPQGIEQQSVQILEHTLEQTHLPALAAMELVTVTDTGHIQAGSRFAMGLRFLVTTRTVSSN